MSDFVPVLVIGVSGATWDVVAPLLAAGRMPNLARLRERGVHGVLRSVRVAGDEHFRPQVAWATAATGCLPERHGVSRYFHEARDLREPPLWEVWSGQGGTVGVYGWPGTWPPPAVRGFVVPSHLARDDRTWPPRLAPIKRLDRLQQTLEREPRASGRLRATADLAALAVRHRVTPRTVAGLVALAARSARTAPGERRLWLRAAKLELTADVFLDLRRRFRPDFASFHTFLADFAMHRHWADVQTDAIGATHARVDAVIGRLVAASPPRTVVAVCSEHGMAPEPRTPEHGGVYWSIRGRGLLDFVGRRGAAVPGPVARWVAYRPPGGGAQRPRLADDLRDVTVVETGLPLLQVEEHVDEVIAKLDLPADVDRYREGSLETLHVAHGGRVAPFSAESAPARSSRRQTWWTLRRRSSGREGCGSRTGSTASLWTCSPEPVRWSYRASRRRSQCCQASWASTRRRPSDPSKWRRPGSSASATTRSASRSGESPRA